MSYTLSLTNGNPIIANGLSDGTVDTTSTSISLIGKNYPGYGKLLNENFVHLLENFANLTSPASALPGQLWWDSGNKVLKVNTAAAEGQTAAWKTLTTIVNAGSKSAAIAGATPLAGDLWWDTTNRQLKIYSAVLTTGDDGWITVGPVSNTTTGQTGAVPDTIQGTDAASYTSNHVVIKFYIEGSVHAIFSKDPIPWVPDAAIDGFSTIRQGLNMRSDANYQYYGSANVALSLMVNGVPVPASNFARSDTATITTVPLITSNNGGVSFGLTGNLVANVNPINGNIGIWSTVSNKDVLFFSNVGGTISSSPILRINSTDGVAEVNTSPTQASSPNQIATKSYVDTANTYVQTYFISNAGGFISGNLIPSANVTYNLGNVTSWYNSIYGRSIQAAYADLAERFEADAEYAVGTVVELGGSAEITVAKDELSETVFGVISKQAAYLMNAAKGTDSTHPPVAISGRVPVNVVGKINKGDRLVSAGNGVARAAAKTEITPWNVIGRSLQNKLDDGYGEVEAIVMLNI